MNEDSPINNGEKHNGFPLVRRPSSAVEKAAPSAKRILSGMVADTHALAKNKERKKLRVVVLDDEEGPRRSCVAALKHCLHHAEEILEFEDSLDAWKQLSRTAPDLFITDIAHTGMTCLEMLTGLAERKVKYPVLVISARLGLELEPEKYPEAAAHIQQLKRDRRPNLNVYFLPKPYTLKEFQTVLERALKINIPRPPHIILVNDEEGILEVQKIIIRTNFKNVTIQTFQDSSEAWRELSREDPDLLITDDKMPGLTGADIVRRLANRNATYPIIVWSPWSPTEDWVRECANRGLDVSFLAQPFDLESFVKALESALKTPRDPTTDALTVAHAEDSETIFKRGLNYSRGEGVPQDDAEAAKWFRKAAEMGFARAQSVLGVCYGNGVGVPKDEIESFKWCQKAAEQDFAEAQDNLGRCYEHGHGVQQNFAEAIKWYRKAAENGEKNAQYKLGRCLDDGTGVPKNIVEAYKWYHKAAEQGLPEAQFMIGHCLMTGEGVTPDIAEGAKWYRKSADQEFSPAQVNLAMCYRHGQGVPKNLTEAAQWYRKAAEQGDAEAQFSLGDFYRRGEGVPQDYTEAANWYRKAAEQGVFAAQNNLGVCYEKGLGVPKDQAEADKWFRKAAKQKSL